MADAALHHASAEPGRARAAMGQDDVRGRLRGVILHELTPTERLLVLLWYAERMSPAEVARSLDMTHDQARAMHERVLRRLRRAVAA